MCKGNTSTLGLHESADAAACSDQGNVAELGMNIANLSLDSVGGRKKGEEKKSSGHKQSVNKHHKSAGGRRMEA